MQEFLPIETFFIFNIKIEILFIVTLYYLLKDQYFVKCAERRVRMSNS